MNASYAVLKSILAAYIKACSIHRLVRGEFPLPEGPKIIAANDMKPRPLVIIGSKEGTDSNVK